MRTHLKGLQMHIRDGTGSQQRRFNFHHLPLSKEAPDLGQHRGTQLQATRQGVMLPFSHAKSTLKGGW